MTRIQKSLIIGALVGAVLGVVGGYLFSRGMEIAEGQNRSQALSLRQVPPGQAVRLFTAVLGVFRGIAEIGESL
ncbi:hypothetical protein ACFLT5_02210 [Chloroflexota bacterium]